MRNELYRRVATSAHTAIMSLGDESESVTFLVGNVVSEEKTSNPNNFLLFVMFCMGKALAEKYLPLFYIYREGRTACYPVLTKQNRSPFYAECLIISKLTFACRSAYQVKQLQDSIHYNQHCKQRYRRESFV